MNFRDAVSVHRAEFVFQCGEWRHGDIDDYEGKRLIDKPCEELQTKLGHEMALLRMKGCYYSKKMNGLSAHRS